MATKVFIYGHLQDSYALTSRLAYPRFHFDPLAIEDIADVR